MNVMVGQMVLVLRCPERPGIVAAVSTLLRDNGMTIDELTQYSDPSLDTFFTRIVFHPMVAGRNGQAWLRSAFTPLADSFGMDWELHSSAERPRVLIGVSKFGHCLFDLLHRWKSGLLPIDVVGVFSNHQDMRSFVEWNELPYHYLPVSADSRADQEQAILALVDRYDVDFTVLARYMQILSPQLCSALAGRCINIHHSFLPSFKGAKPYHQAYAKGVKMIGATAHFVTNDLDEGPIIAQDARHVSHAFTPQELIALGQEVECAVLARAVGWHAAHRVINNGAKTIVFAPA